MVETEVEAYDVVDDTIDMLTGVWKALGLRANGEQERDEFSLMLSEVVYVQLESLRDVLLWLGEDAEQGSRDGNSVTTLLNALSCVIPSEERPAVGVRVARHALWNGFRRPIPVACFYM